MKQKGLRKLVSIVLMLVMVLTMSATAFAADIISSNTDYSITITNANKGETYAAYKIFDATYSGSSVTYYIGSNVDNYAYYTKVADNAAKTEGALFTLVTTGTSGYYQVVVNEGVTDSDIISFFTNLGALGTTASAQDTAETDGELILYPGAAGYYFVTTTTGSVVSIDSAYPSVEITDKNEEPIVVKTVVEDSTSVDGATNTADIGDTVKYIATISDAWDVNKLTYHDTMSSGLTFKSESVSVKVGENALAVDEDYTLEMSCSDGCTFEIEFTSDGLTKVTDDSIITITYEATVNSSAVIGGTGNTNTGKITYGDAGSVTSSTTTYVYEVEVYKYTNTTETVEGEEVVTKTPLANAEFVLYKTVDNENYYAKVTNGKLTGWTTTKSEASTLTSGADGKVSVEGLDADTYYLEETKAPNGYNLLKDPVTFTINEDGTVTYETKEVTQVGVENKAGSSLPSTGGMGTTIFYIVGSVLVLGAAVLFVAKKRLGGEN